MEKRCGILAGRLGIRFRAELYRAGRLIISHVDAGWKDCEKNSLREEWKVRRLVQFHD